MPRGGKRIGAGRKPGSRNKPKLTLTSEPSTADSSTSPRVRMAELRKRVALYKHNQFSDEEIAAVLGLTVEKLRVVFPRELEFGSALTKAAALDNLLAAGDAGKVAANTKIIERVAADASDGTQSPKLGKKAAAQAAAEAVVAGSSVFNPRPLRSVFAPGPPPGKKALAAAQAETAEQGTPWQSLVQENCEKPN